MVTFSTHVIPSAADVGPGVPAFDCAGEATILTSHNVGRSQVSHNRWTTQPQTAHRTLVCLFHQVYFGSVLTISVRDSSETIVSGDACTYLVVHGAR